MSKRGGSEAAHPTLTASQAALMKREWCVPARTLRLLLCGGGGGGEEGEEEGADHVGEVAGCGGRAMVGAEFRYS